MANFSLDYDRMIKSRIAQCVELEFQWDLLLLAYKKDGMYIPMVDIKTMNNSAWANLIEDIKEEIKRRADNK